LTKTFTLTSTEPYDRHDYRLVLKNGKSMIFNDYETLRAQWFNWCHMGNLSHVEVLDKNVSKKKAKGFS